MSSTYSTNLAIELIGTGDQAGSWGNTTNTNLGTLIEQAISGYVTQAVSTGTDTTITIPNGATGVARNMYIELTGTGGTNTNLIVPANKKLYFIYNNSTGAVTVKVSGQTGVSVPTGKKVVLTSNGTDVVNGLNYIADFGSNSATITTLSATSATITNLTLTSLVISNLSIASANITTLTSTNATAASLTVSTGNLTFSSTAQRITGDMSNATVANRLMFQSSVADSSTSVNAIPSGTNTASNIRAVNNSTPTNSAFTGLAATSSESQLVAGIYGTGTYLPMTFYTGGSERMRIDSSSGYVGIGTASPGVNLDVNGTARAGLGANVYVVLGDAAGSSSPTTYVGLDYDGTNNRGRLDALSGGVAWRDIGINTRGGNTLLALGGGNVGIGAAPSYTLDVNTASATFRVRDASGGNDFGIKSVAGPVSLAGSRANTAIGFMTNDTERMRIDSSGNVGIGAATGTARLVVQGAGTSTTAGGNVVGRFQTNGSGYDASIQLSDNVANSAVFSMVGGAINFISNGSNYMNISSSGNVGIGTASPTSKLHVYQTGSASTMALIYNNTNAAELKVQTNANDAAFISFYTNGNRNWSVGPGQTTANLFEIRDLTASATRMGIDSSGNVGIGTASPATKFNVYGDTNAAVQARVTNNNAGASAASFFTFGNNADGYIGYVGCVSSAASVANGVLLGNRISGPLLLNTNDTERMRIDSSGNVGIGTTSPDTILHVAGQITARGVANATIIKSGISASINNDATLTLTGVTQGGLLFIDTNDVALFICNGQADTTTEISDPSGVYSNTQGTASSTNIYYSGGVLTIENKTGVSRGYRISYLTNNA